MLSTYGWTDADVLETIPSCLKSSIFFSVFKLQTAALCQHKVLGTNTISRLLHIGEMDEWDFRLQEGLET